jgi:predicted dienelactone hydrolase
MASRPATALLICMAAESTCAAGLSTTVATANGKVGNIEVLVWTPCKAAPSETRVGPFTFLATKECEVLGRSLPLVVISHGQGGTRLGHHDTAIALADMGFVVATFSHPGDSFGDDSLTNKISAFETRPTHVSHVIDHLLKHWKHRELIDAQSVGVFGFSRGGYTALALAGALPSMTASASRLCGFWRWFTTPICRQIGAETLKLNVQADIRVKSVVAADPLNLFDASTLKSIKVPVQLWASEFGGAGVEFEHTQLIRDSLPQSTEFHVAKGAGHFAYLAPCSEELRKDAKSLCEDPKGFDRQRWHSTMNKAISAFFMRTLRAGEK